MRFASIFRQCLVTPLAHIWWAWVALRLWLAGRPRGANNRHVLLVTWDFPPATSSGTNVPASFARHAALGGWRVSVVCSPCAANPTSAGRDLIASIPGGVSVYRVARWLATERRMRLHPAWGTPEIDGSYLDALGLAITAFKRLRGDAPGVVLASGPPFSNFLAARWLARVFGAKLVLQYRDEWTLNTPAFVNVTPADAAVETRCLREADLVTFVSKGKEVLYRRAFDVLASSRCLTVANGWEPYFHERARWDSRHLPRDAFNITYTGRWHISLAPLLAAFEQVLMTRTGEGPALRLVFVGTQLPENDRLIADFRSRHPSNLLSLPARSPTEAIEIQRESPCLLLINDHLYSGVVPLKTFDYMCSNRPILVFGRTGGAAAIVESHGAGIAVDTADCGGFAAAIEQFMAEPHAWDTPSRQAWCADHSRAVLIPQLLGAMAALLHTQPVAASLVTDELPAEETLAS